MSSARTSGMWSGAAQGAAIGGMYGNWYGAAIGAVAGGVIGLYSGAATDRSQANQSAWQRYNASLQQSSELYNLQAQLGIAAFNIQAAQMQANFQNQVRHETINYNVNMQMAALAYESKLLDNEIEKTWNALDLDITQIEQARARELGSLVADQAASGVTIGDGSTADVVIDQQTQEALEISVTKFNADQTVAEIQDAKARSSWEAEIAISKMLWEGATADIATSISASMQGAGQATTALLSGRAGLYNANQHAFMAGIAVDMGNAQYSLENNQRTTASLFSAAGTATRVYYRNKTPSDKGSHAGDSLLGDQ